MKIREWLTIEYCYWLQSNNDFRMKSKFTYWNIMLHDSMKNMTFVCLIDELFRDDGNVQPNNNKGNECN